VLGWRTATGRHSTSRATGFIRAATATVHLMGTRKPREGIVVRGNREEVRRHRPPRPIAFAASDVDSVRKRLQSEA